MSGQSAGATAKAAVEHPVKKGSGAMGSVHMKLVMIMVLLIVFAIVVFVRKRRQGDTAQAATAQSKD